MALLQQPTVERMVSTFLTAYVCGINIISRDHNEFEFAASQCYAYNMRKSNFPDFQGIFPYFPDFSQNLKFP